MGLSQPQHSQSWQAFQQNQPTAQPQSQRNQLKKDIQQQDLLQVPKSGPVMNHRNQSNGVSETDTHQVQYTQLDFLPTSPHSSHSSLAQKASQSLTQGLSGATQGFFLKVQ